MKRFARTTVLKTGRVDRKRWVTLLAIVSLVCQCASNPTGHVLAADTAESKQGGRRQAILIGIAEYQKAPPLGFTANDVRELGLTLRERGDYDVLEIVDSARETTDSRSEREAMQAAVEDCLRQLGPNDDALLYFSGHGFRDAEGKLYLAQIDCDPANPEPGGVPVAWLREQLADCEAKFKLLIIDACHGGSEKGDIEIVSVTAKDLGMPFQNLESVVTLASSQSNEKSLVWFGKCQSLFTYWLNQGLKGHSDRNGNGEVTIDELYEYVFENVTKVADGYFKRKQTPVRIIRSGTPGVPVLISLKPHSLKGLLDDMAEQLATEMQFHGWSELGIPEFLVDTGDDSGELLGGEFGTLGRYCAAELGGYLMRRSGGKFAVIEHDALQEELASKGHAARDLGTLAMKDLAGNGDQVRVLAKGVLRSRTGSVITIQCKLTALNKQDGFGFASGTAALNEDEYGMLGRSYDATPIPDAPTVDAPEPRDPIELADQASQGAHPLQDPNFPYRVTILVDGKERKAVFRGNDMFVALSPSEVYAIDIENRDHRDVLMRLLVDGRNTLPEEAGMKGVTVEPRNDQPIYLPAQRVNLSEAKYWCLDPIGMYQIQGFFSNLAEDGTGTYMKFKVANAPDSPSAREHFGEELGMITAAFYAPSGPRDMITEPGEEYEIVLGYKYITSVGKQLAVVNIRYVEPEAFQKISEEVGLSTEN